MCGGERVKWGLDVMEVKLSFHLADPLITAHINIHNPPFTYTYH